VFGALSGDCNALSFARLEMDRRLLRSSRSWCGCLPVSASIGQESIDSKCQTCTKCLHLHNRAVLLCISGYLSMTLPGDVDTIR
jgi:hypothetical protein